MVRMSNEKTEMVNLLKVLNVLRHDSGLTLTEVTSGLGLTRVTTKKHLENLTDQRNACSEGRKYHLTKEGEQCARLLEDIIRSHSWGKEMSLPQIMVIATAGIPTVTFIGYDGNVIRNVYDDFKDFVEATEKDGFIVSGTLKVSRRREDS